MTTLEELIALIESDNNPFAMRFEPHVYDLTQKSNRYEAMVNVAKARNRCSRPTACVIVATSWGKYQIMGFNLYDAIELSYPHSVGKFMATDGDQDATFKAFCQAKNIYFTLPDMADPAFALRFAHVYNGSPEYAKKIASRLLTS